jgi:hypothetical protein
MRQPFATVAIVIVLAVASVKALIGAQAAVATELDGFGVASVLLRLSIAGFGVFAIGATLRQRRHARQLVLLWGVAMLAAVILPDFALGFTRDGLQGRLLATGLVAGLLAAVVLSVPRNAPTKASAVAPSA